MTQELSSSDSDESDYFTKMQEKNFRQRGILPQMHSSEVLSLQSTTATIQILAEYEWPIDQK